MRRNLNFYSILLGCLILAISGQSRDGMAASVVVSWDRNTESDLSGYRIYYGVRSRDYDRTIYVGEATSFQVNGLRTETRYYFAVTAIDYSGNESAFSEEVSIDVPADAPGGSGPEPVEEDGQTLANKVYNFPNPFRVGSGVTRIRYEILNPGEVTIDILDMNNNVVKTVVQGAFRGSGEHTQDSWDGTNSENQPVANGVYVCRIRTAGEYRFIKIAVIR